MKVLFAVLAIVALANGHIRVLEKVKITRIVPRNLDHLLRQFIDFIPYDKCLKIDERYYKNDPDVRDAYDFLTSNECAELSKRIRELPEFQEANKFVEDAGLDIYKYGNALRRIFNLPPYEPIPPKEKSSESGIILMVREILNVIPIHEIKEWFMNVCSPDPNFQYFLTKIRSQEYIDLQHAIYTSPENVELYNATIARGIDFKEIQKVIDDYIASSYSMEENMTWQTLLVDLKTFMPLLFDQAVYQESPSLYLGKIIP